ncbi:MAG: methyltransferase domain-containing protein [Betaproteobacteria bacterium]|nr:methyltransferase domain-containing protein [Betaproteobacteria bacterium]
MAWVAVQPGEVVGDIACGTGATLVRLGEAVGETGRAIGLEHSAEMARIAEGRIRDHGMQDRCKVRLCAVESYLEAERFDALLFCFTHDVLQSPEAVRNICAHARDGARVVVAGTRFLPWAWGLPLNLFTAIRGRRYLTTYRGLRMPWRHLLAFCPDFKILETDHWGTSYLGAGTIHHPPNFKVQPSHNTQPAKETT